MSSSQAHGHLNKLETERNTVLNCKMSQLVKEPLITTAKTVRARVCLFVCLVLKFINRFELNFRKC